MSRNPYLWTPARDARVRELYQAGHTWQEIAETFHTTRAAAVARGHRLGLVSREGLPVTAAAKPAPKPFTRGMQPLPAGHAETWGLLVAGTLLDGVQWPEGMGTPGEG
jgi:hypothetical protein